MTLQLWQIKLKGNLETAVVKSEERVWGTRRMTVRISIKIAAAIQGQKCHGHFSIILSIH